MARCTCLLVRHVLAGTARRGVLWGHIDRCCRRLFGGDECLKPVTPDLYLSQCFGGNSVQDAATLGFSTTCNMKCTGDNNTICGGEGTLDSHAAQGACMSVLLG